MHIDPTQRSLHWHIDRLTLHVSTASRISTYGILWYDIDDNHRIFHSIGIVASTDKFKRPPFHCRRRYTNKFIVRPNTNIYLVASPEPIPSFIRSEPSIQYATHCYCMKDIELSRQPTHIAVWTTARDNNNTYAIAYTYFAAPDLCQGKYWFRREHLVKWNNLLYWAVVLSLARISISGSRDFISFFSLIKLRPNLYTEKPYFSFLEFLTHFLESYSRHNYRNCANVLLTR